MATTAAPPSPTKELSLAEKSELCKKVRNQIEYYFGDFNLQSDDFLKRQIDINGCM